MDPGRANYNALLVAEDASPVRILRKHKIRQAESGRRFDKADCVIDR